MLYKSSCTILTDDTSGSLHDRLASAGASALLHTLQLIQDNQLKPIKQDDSGACYAHKLTKEEGLIDWSNPADIIDRQVRGLSPWPIAYTTLGEGNLRVLSASPQPDTSASKAQPGTILETRKDSIIIACGNGTALGINRLQLPGGKPLATRDVLNSRKELFSTGVHLGI
jgi:methionyl-tRNA formyltransferase